MKSKITIFNTPFIRHIFRLLALTIFKLSGWKFTGTFPEHKKMIVILAPHTSNWDLPIALFLSFALKLKPNWLGKESIFSFPFKTVMMWLGGIPVDRSQKTNMVDAAIEILKNEDEIILSLAPEGTRKRVSSWKSGFYHIALGAGIPISCAYIDYLKKEAGFGPFITPTGDPEKDLIPIREFYCQKTGRFPEKFNKEGITLKK